MKRRQFKFAQATTTLSPAPAYIAEIKEFLDELPIDELRDIKFLATLVGRRPGFLSAVVREFLPAEYHFKAGVKYWFANRKTVKLQQEGAYDGQSETE